MAAQNPQPQRFVRARLRLQGTDSSLLASLRMTDLAASSRHWAYFTNTPYLEQAVGTLGGVVLSLAGASPVAVQERGAGIVGQGDAEGAAASNGALYRNVPAVGFHDGFADGQPQPQ